jgi:hypothetical protein
MVFQIAQIYPIALALEVATGAGYTNDLNDSVIDIKMGEKFGAK